MSDTPIYDNMTNPAYKRDYMEQKPNMQYVYSDEYTPNVAIENPNTRRTVTKIASVVGGLLAVAFAVDIASAELDFSVVTYPVAAGFGAFVSYYGIKVTLPNTPKRG